jgi:hypothetical protein
MSKYPLLVGLLISLAMSSCKIDRICPAYQSYYLLDENTQTNTFAYIDEDNFPRRDLPNSERDKNGLVKSEWYVVKNWQMRTIPMQVVYPEIDDSLIFAGDVIMFAETDVIDSVALDSARSAALGFRYNNDQKFYNWYFRDRLVWADDQYPQDDRTTAIKVSKEEKVKKPFFQRIFKSKEDRARNKAEKRAAKEQQANEPKAEKKKKRAKKSGKKDKQQADDPLDNSTDEDEEDGF